DLGPGLEYHFLFFNQNDPAPSSVKPKQAWFGDERFRRAISLAIDRASLVRLAYSGRGTPLWGPVTPGNRLWANAEIARTPPSLDAARKLLAEAGFVRHADGAHADRGGTPVAFSILVGAVDALGSRDRSADAAADDDARRWGAQAPVRSRSGSGRGQAPARAARQPEHRRRREARPGELPTRGARTLHAVERRTAVLAHDG